MEPQAPRGGQGRWRALGALPPTLLFDMQISSWTCWGGLGGDIVGFCYRKVTWTCEVDSPGKETLLPSRETS